MVDQTQSSRNPWVESIESAIEDRLVAIDSGNYREECARVLREFAGFIARSRRVTQLEDIDTDDCQAYARHLRTRVRDDDDDLASSRTARKNWKYVRSWLEWCVRNQRMQTNPAKPDRASAPLPQGDPAESQQFWSEREREAICATADRRVDEALDDDDLDTDQAYRDRAMVYVLAYSGVRGAEIARVSSDRHRDGITWEDVDTDRGILTVLGKARGKDDPREHAPVLSPAVSALERWRSYRDPPASEVVFPRLDRAADDHDPDAISTQSIRTVLAELCEWSQYEFDEVLKPHGARRGLGDQLYQESAELAQNMLRHKSIETTHDSYTQERQSQVGDEAEDALLGDEP